MLVAPHVQDYAIDLVMATQPGRRMRTNSRISIFATAVRREARKRWWSAAACWR